MDWRKIVDGWLAVKSLKQKLGDISSFIKALQFACSVGEWDRRDLLILDNAVSTLGVKVNTFITSFYDEVITLSDIENEERLHSSISELPQTLRTITKSLHFKNKRQFKLNLCSLETIVYKIFCCFQQDKNCDGLDL